MKKRAPRETTMSFNGGPEIPLRMVLHGIYGSEADEDALVAMMFPGPKAKR